MKNIILILFALLHLPLYAAPLSWQSCEEDPFYLWQDDEPRMQCALLNVPLAYHHDNRSPRKNNSRTITLALSRIPAEGERLGSLIFVSGGPGQSGIQPALYDNLHTQTLRKHFDLIFYDPRGVGLSTPRIQCHDYGESLAESAHDFVAGCQAHSEPGLLAHIGSDEAANDLDRIRRALGDEKISLVAYSYGTKVATLYALRSPEHVRAIVLDGIVDLFESDYSIRLHQEKNYQRTFERYVAHCTRAPHCPFAAGHSGANALLPLMAWRATLAARPPHWTETLYNHVAPFLDLDEKTRYIPEEQTILNAVQNALLWPDYWPFLSDSLLLFAQGEGDYLNYLGSNFEEFGDDALVAINCADMARPMSDGENLILQRHIDLQSPYDNHHLKTRNDLIDPCGLWPYPGGDYRNPLPAVRPAALPPLLLIAQRHDPATPWHNAERMARYLQSPLVTRESDGHTLTFTGISTCIDDIAGAYLLDPQQPRTNAICE